MQQLEGCNNGRERFTLLFSQPSNYLFHTKNMFSVMICQDRDWLGPSYKRLLIITFLKVYGENTSGKLFLEPDPPTCQIY